jgi:5-methylcytosine-specific restriction endonuclease McrA
MTLEYWSYLFRLPYDETQQVIDELQLFGVCEVARSDDGKITLTSRRLQKRLRINELSRKRVAKFREKGGGSRDKWTAIRVEILKLDGYVCAYCGQISPDHRTPKALPRGMEAAGLEVAVRTRLTTLSWREDCGPDRSVLLK